MTVDGTTNVTRTTWVSIHKASQLLGMNDMALARCAYYGAIPVKKAGRRAWRVAIDPHWRNGTCLYDAYAAGIAEWDHETAYAHKRIRAAALVDYGHPQPVGLDAFVVEAQSPTGLDGKEILAYFEERRKGGTHLRRILTHLPDHVAAARRRRKRIDVPLELVLKAHPRLRLPDTCATRDDGTVPDPMWLGVAMGCTHVADLACAAQIVVAENPDHAARIGRGFEALDDQLRAQGAASPPSPQDVVGALRTILDRTRARTTHRHMPVLGVRSVVSVLRLLTIYRSSHPDQLGWLAHLLHPDTYRDRDLNRELNRLAHRIHKEAIANRQKDAEIVKDRFEDLRQAATGRVAEAQACVEAVRAATPFASAHFKAFDDGTEEHPFFAFEAMAPLLDASGVPVPGDKQMVGWRIWREKDLWRSLDPRDDLCPNYSGLAQDNRLQLAAYSGVYNSLDYARKRYGCSDRIVCEYAGTRSVAGGSTREPHFAAIYRLGVVSDPCYLPPGLQRERLAYFSDNRLARTSGGMGPLGFGKASTGLAGWARRFGRCIVPIEDYALAMRFGGNAIEVVSECHARLAEVLQMTQSPQCMRIDLGPSCRGVGFRAIAKGQTSEREFLLTQGTFYAALALAREVGRRFGNAEGVLPSVMGVRNVRRKVADARPFLFQWNGIALSPQALNFIVGIVGAGFGRVTMHILRHASANAKSRLGVPTPTMGGLLGHGDERTTGPYIAATRQQAALDVLREDEEIMHVGRVNAQLAKQYVGAEG